VRLTVDLIPEITVIVHREGETPVLPGQKEAEPEEEEALVAEPEAETEVVEAPEEAETEVAESPEEAETEIEVAEAPEAEVEAEAGAQE
jgi:hypothetical protein